MRNPRQWLVGAICSLFMTGCIVGPEAQQGPEVQQGPAPDARSIVLRYLRSEQIPPTTVTTTGPGVLFTDPRKLGLIELSTPNSVQHPTLGWTWLVCLRTHPIGRPTNDYALFIGLDRIRDARLSIGTDRCATRPYQVLGVFEVPVKKPDAQKRRRAGGKL